LEWGDEQWGCFSFTNDANPILSGLTLLSRARFAFQPLALFPNDFGGLNEALTDFFAKSCTFIDPDEWLEAYPYKEAFFGDSKEWMDR
jgi:hypothetical protein